MINKFEGGMPSQEYKTTEDLKREKLERVRSEREKLEQFGRIGQRIKIVGRSMSPNGEVIGEIIALETENPFNEELLSDWEKQENGNMQNLPSSTVKVFITEGERKGQIVASLAISEWEPID
ncbi:MAG: hypothetical protein WC842_04300 [Candidatus Paceibacterota bacterium]|jgi:hypothetical protein